MKKALITGIGGQDGSYLAELLLEKGYEVFGIETAIAFQDNKASMWRLESIMSSIKLFIASVDDYELVLKIVKDIMPDECYHLAAQSFVSYLFADERSTLNNNINGTHSILSALKSAAPNCRFFFAASSEMFGDVKETPQNECTPFYPRSIYGISKVAGFELTRFYRKAYGSHASCGILFNHESERRSSSFVTRKITLGVSRIISGIDEKLELGNLDARRDWGYAPEYVIGMWKILQNEKPDDFILATNETHSVKEFVEESFKVLDDEIIWKWNECKRNSKVNRTRGNMHKSKILQRK